MHPAWTMCAAKVIGGSIFRNTRQECGSKTDPQSPQAVVCDRSSRSGQSSLGSGLVLSPYCVFRVTSGRCPVRSRLRRGGAFCRLILSCLYGPIIIELGPSQ